MTPSPRGARPVTIGPIIRDDACVSVDDEFVPDEAGTDADLQVRKFASTDVGPCFDRYVNDPATTTPGQLVTELFEPVQPA